MTDPTTAPAALDALEAERDEARDDCRALSARCAALEAERDAALARVAELEAPGECQSLHKLRAEVERLKVELAKPVARGFWL